MLLLIWANSEHKKPQSFLGANFICWHCQHGKLHQYILVLPNLHPPAYYGIHLIPLHSSYLNTTGQAATSADLGYKKYPFKFLSSNVLSPLNYAKEHHRLEQNQEGEEKVDSETPSVHGSNQHSSIITSLQTQDS